MTDITRKRGDTYADEFIIKSKTTKLPIKTFSGIELRNLIWFRIPPTCNTRTPSRLSTEWKMAF